MDAIKNAIKRPVQQKYLCVFSKYVISDISILFPEQKRMKMIKTSCLVSKNRFKLLKLKFK